MATATPEGSTHDATPSASFTYTASTADRKASMAYSVATTPTFYGFNVTPRQVRYYACERDSERMAEGLTRGHITEGIGLAYLARLRDALSKATLTRDLADAKQVNLRAKRDEARDRVIRKALESAVRSADRALENADHRKDLVATAFETVRVALLARANAEADRTAGDRMAPPETEADKRANC